MKWQSKPKFEGELAGERSLAGQERPVIIHCFWSLERRFDVQQETSLKRLAKARAGTVFAVANVFPGLGTTLGNVIGGYIPSLYGSLRYVFIVASTLASVAMVITMTLCPANQYRRLSAFIRSFTVLASYNAKLMGVAPPFGCGRVIIGIP